MNLNEYGVQFRFGTGFTMSSETSLTFTFTRPDGTTFSRPATLQSSPVTTSLGTFAANQWASYTFVQGDINQVGVWQARLTYADGSPAQLISGIGTFTINP